MLENQYQYEFREAGCDEAGRGCLAGPVFAAAVILPPDFHDPLLNDSKQMTERNRDRSPASIRRPNSLRSTATASGHALNYPTVASSRATANMPTSPQLRCWPKPIGTSTCCASRRNIRSTAGKRTRGTRPASIGSQSGNTDLRPTTVCRSVTGSASWSCNSERGLSFRVLPGNPVVIGYDHLPRLNPRPEFTLPSCSGGHTFEDAGGRITIGMAHKKGLKSDFSPFSI